MTPWFGGWHSIHSGTPARAKVVFLEIHGVCFFQSDSLSLLFEAFRTFSLNVIINTSIFKFTNLLLVFYWTVYSFLRQSFPGALDQLRISFSVIGVGFTMCIFNSPRGRQLPCVMVCSKDTSSRSGQDILLNIKYLTPHDTLKQLGNTERSKGQGK